MQLDGIHEAARAKDPAILDLRDLLWASIDNDESRDLDQLSVAEEQPGGAVNVRIAIADVDAAVEHVRRYGSAHTEGVVSADDAAIERFTRGVDAAAVVVNGSLRLHDGPTLGLGSEISISTGRLHVRGPVTVSALLTHTWVVEARGALRAERGN